MCVFVLRQTGQVTDTQSHTDVPCQLLLLLQNISNVKQSSELTLTGHMQKQHRRWLHLLRKGPHIHLLASSVNHGPDLDRSGRPPYMVVATSIALVYIHLLGSNYSCRQSYYSLDCVNIEPRRTMNPPKERRQPHKHLSWPGRAPVGFIGLTSPHRIITQTYRSLVEAFGQPATIQSHERRTTSRTLTFFVCPIGGFILLCFS